MRSSCMPLTAEDLRRIAERTLAHYDERAEAFWAGTRDHDVSQNINALLQYIEASPPFELLDFGCGPGRDLAAFKALGHHAIGLEGSAQLAAMARAHSGCTVLEQNFLELTLPASDLMACSPTRRCFMCPARRCLACCWSCTATLKPGGVLFSSNPRGDGQEGWNGGRYGVFHDWETWRGFMTAAGFVELTHFYRPTGLPPEQQPWLASVWRKPLS